MYKGIVEGSPSEENLCLSAAPTCLKKHHFYLEHKENLLPVHVALFTVSQLLRESLDHVCGHVYKLQPVC